MQDDSPVFRVGLTGGIASGKTTVANMFGALGVTLIDTDVIAREVVAPGTSGLRDVVAAFGSNVLREDGSLDRRALRTIVFASDTKRRELEGIVHPLIRAETMRQMAITPDLYQLIVVPLLVESPLRQAVDRVLVVDCAEEVQLERLLQRDDETAQQARAMIDAQSSREDRLAIADDIVDNAGDLDASQQQVEDLHREYLRLSARKRR